MLLTWGEELKQALQIPAGGMPRRPQSCWCSPSPFEGSSCSAPPLPEPRKVSPQELRGCSQPQEFVKPEFAVWPWESHFPSLGLSGLIGNRGTVMAFLPTPQGSCGGSKHCWVDFFGLSIKRDRAKLERVPEE